MIKLPYIMYENVIMKLTILYDYYSLIKIPKIQHRSEAYFEWDYAVWVLQSPSSCTAHVPASIPAVPPSPHRKSQHKCCTNTWSLKGIGPVFKFHFVVLPNIYLIRIFGLQKEYPNKFDNITGNVKWSVDIYILLQIFSFFLDSAGSTKIWICLERENQIIWKYVTLEWLWMWLGLVTW
jgi:hypothetical protein